MSELTESEKAKAELFAKSVDLKNMLFSSAASTFAYNKINNLLLMQVLAKVENRDLEEIRNNVDKYIAQFTQEFIDKNETL